MADHLSRIYLIKRFNFGWKLCLDYKLVWNIFSLSLLHTKECVHTRYTGDVVAIFPDTDGTIP